MEYALEGITNQLFAARSPVGAGDDDGAGDDGGTGDDGGLG